MAIIGLVTGLLPLITSTVQAVEGIFGAGNGATKKQAATAAIADILNIANSVRPTAALQSSAMMEGIGEVIDGIVKILNATGVFVTTSK